MTKKYIKFEPEPSINEHYDVLYVITIMAPEDYGYTGIYYYPSDEPGEWNWTHELAFTPMYDSTTASRMIDQFREWKERTGRRGLATLRAIRAYYK